MFRLGKYRPQRRRAQQSSIFFQSFGKRGFDIAVATAALLLLSPLILLISLGIRIDSSGPALHRHKRYNSNNVEFELFEFRIRLVDRREKTFDCRINEMRCITGFGQMLRDAGMHRLPLLINVLRGELSIVGSHLFAHAPGASFPPLDLRGIKPGLVGWGHASDDWAEIADAPKTVYHSIQCDRFYVENCSFFLDMKILLHILLSKKMFL